MEVEPPGASGGVQNGGGPRNEVCFIHSPILLASADRNPRYTGRAELVYSLIEAYGLLDHVRVVVPQKASRRQLQGFHSKEYVNFLETHSNQSDSEDEEEDAEEMGLGYDCPLFTGCYDYACDVGGAGLTSADLLLKGEARVVINWYGGWHHAKRDAAAGYCYCNDIVMAILQLQTHFQRILYVDIDVHHGDGVEEAFWHSSKVMAVSFHHYSPGYFPGTGGVGGVGGGRGKFYTVNVPLHEGVGDDQYHSLFSGVLCEVKGRYQPQCVVIQCGADPLSDDPLGEFNLTPRGAGECVNLILQWRLPTILMGGGGYNFPNTARFWTLCTALAVGQHLTNDIPDHKHFTKYGPDYQLNFPAGNRGNKNSVVYVSQLMHTISGHLSNISSP